MPAWAQATAPLAPSTNLNDCPAKVVVETKQGPQCAYTVRVHVIQGTFNSLDIFTLPTAAVIKGFQIYSPLLGDRAARSFRDESNGGYGVFAPPAAGYVPESHHRVVTSGGPSSERWTTMPDGSVRYAYSIRLERDLLRGNVRKWFKGAIAQIDRRVEHMSRPEEIAAIKATVDTVAREALAAEARAIAARKPARDRANVEGGFMHRRSMRYV